MTGAILYDEVICATDKLHPQYIKGKQYIGTYEDYNTIIVVDEYNNNMSYDTERYRKYFKTKAQLRCDNINMIVDENKV